MPATACRWIITLALVAVAAPLPSPARAALDYAASTQRPRQFQVLPFDNPVLQRNARITSLLKRPVIVKSGAASAYIRQGFINAVLCTIAGALGLIVIGFRLYGNRHGNAAT
jgi:hypothetical protein